MKIALVLIVFHFFADFFFQNDKMATKKSTSNRWLTIHICTYMIVFSPFAMYMDYAINGYQFVSFGNVNAFYWWTLNGCLHWITDYFTSRLSSYLYQKAEKNPGESYFNNSWRHWFFCCIGADQVIHYATLFITYKLLLA